MAFRCATKKDLPVLVNLVSNLVSEKGRLPKELISKKGHDIGNWSFGEDSDLSFIVAEKTERENRTEIIGYASYYHTFSTWNGRTLHVKDVFVGPEYRRKGIGSGLIREIVQAALTKGCERVDWLVNCDRKIELDFSIKFKPVFVDFLNYKMSKKSVIAFSNGGLMEKRDLESISIKSGTEDHIKDLLALITELAVYENEPEAVMIGEKELFDSAFGPDKSYSFIVAEAPSEKGSTVIGYSIFFPVYEDLERGIHMEDLYVTPQSRGTGVGTEMMRTLAKIVTENDWDFLRYQVLEWNTGAIALYERLEGQCLEQVKNYRLCRQHMVKILGD